MASTQSNNVQQFFNDLSAGWDDRYKNCSDVEERLNWFTSVLAETVSERSKILDFGCGSGAIARFLSAKGYLVTGVDISPGMIQQAKHKAPNDIIWQIYSGNGEINLPSNSFDATICSSVLEYIDTPQKTLIELHRLLKPGGTIALTVPDMRNSLRKKETWMRALLLLPAVKRIINRTRWAQGFNYLELSRNRWSPEDWVNTVASMGFECRPLPPCRGPLLMLTAFKRK